MLKSETKRARPRSTGASPRCIWQRCVIQLSHIYHIQEGIEFINSFIFFKSRFLSCLEDKLTFPSPLLSLANRKCRDWSGDNQGVKKSYWSAFTEILSGQLFLDAVGETTISFSLQPQESSGENPLWFWDSLTSATAKLPSQGSGR